MPCGADPVTVWTSGEEHTVLELLARRLETDPDGDVPRRLRRDRHRGRGRGRSPVGWPTRLAELGVDPATGWRRSSRTRPRPRSPGGARCAPGPSRCRSTPPTRASTCATSSADSGRPGAGRRGRPRRPGRAASPTRSSRLEHVVVIGDDATADAGASTSHTLGRPARGRRHGARRRRRARRDLATFIYTGGTTGPSKGCMLSHNYHEALARQIGICWGRTADDVVWTPLPLFHFNAITTAVLGPLVYGGRAAIYRRFSVSNFWPEMNRVGATITSTLGTMAYLLAHDVDRPEMPRSGAPEANTIAAAPRRGAAAGRGRRRDPVTASASTTFSGRLRRDRGQPHLVAAARACATSPTPRASSTTSTSTCASSTTTTTSCRRTPTARSSSGPSARRSCSRATGVGPRPPSRPAATGGTTPATSAGSTTTATSTSSTARPTTSAAGARTSPASRSSASSWATARWPTSPCTRCSSELTEDDLKITATLAEGSSLTEEELFRWCIDQLPYFALPRYIEFRAELPRSPVGRVLKRELRDEGVTAATWDVEASGITYEKR